MIDTTITNTVDTDGYVVRVDSGDPVLVKDGQNKRALIVYQERIADTAALIVNPLASGLGDNAASNWFYQRMQASFNSRVLGLIDFLIGTAIKEKSKKDPKNKVKGEEEHHLPMELLKAISPVIDDIDATTLTEYRGLVGDVNEAVEFINIHYQPRQMRCTIRSGLFEEGYTTAPTRSKVRKKTWAVLTKLMRTIFNLKDDEDTHKFASKKTDVSCTKLASYLTTMFNAFSEMNALLDIQDSELSIDLTRWKTHLDNIEDYATNAKFMVQPTMEAANATTQAVPTTTPTVPVVGGGVPQTTTQGTVRIPVIGGSMGATTAPVVMPDLGTAQVPAMQTVGNVPVIGGSMGMNTQMGMPGMGMGVNPLMAPPMSLLGQPQMGFGGVPNMGMPGMGVPVMGMGMPSMGGMGMPVQSPLWPSQPQAGGQVVLPGMRPLM